MSEYNVKIKCIVVDDEPLARDLIVSYVEKTPYFTLVGAFSNAVTASSFLKENEVDLIFLDIQMPQWDGLSLSKVVNKDTRIIFTTAFEQYAIDGYKVDALDYLLKPIDYEEFLSAAEKALRWFEMQYSLSEAAQRDQRERSDSVFLKVDSKMVKFRYDDILCIEGDKDYVKIHTEDGQRSMTLMSMKIAEEILPEKLFCRVHRSWIVNLSKITAIERNRVELAGKFIPVSDSYRGRIKNY